MEKYPPIISSPLCVSNFAKFSNPHPAAAYQPYSYWAESEKYFLDLVYVFYLKELMNTEQQIIDQKKLGINIFQFMLNSCTQVPYFSIHDIYSQSFISFRISTYFRVIQNLLFHIFLIIQKGFSFLSNNKPSEVILALGIFNPFVPSAPFLYPLKTSQNRKVF